MRVSPCRGVPEVHAEEGGDAFSMRHYRPECGLEAGGGKLPGQVAADFPSSFFIF
jgi:hypothetical protein